MSPLPIKSRLRISPPFLLFLLLNISQLAFSASLRSDISYSQHCGSVVPESISNEHELENSLFPHFRGGYFTGGERLLPEDPHSTFSAPKFARLSTTRLTATDAQGVFKIQATLSLSGGSIYGIYNGNRSRSRTLRHRHPAPRFFRPRGKVLFDLHGFWSGSSGKLCLVGTGSGYSKEGNFLDLSVVVKLNYAINATISTSLVTGVVESLNAADSPNYFDKVSILALSESSYRYTAVSEAKKSCSAMKIGENPIRLGTRAGICRTLRDLSRGFLLDYRSNCSEPEKCTPFNGLPLRFMSAYGIRCSDDGKLHLKLHFYNSSSFLYNYHPMAPQSTWVSEGFWDGEQNHLCLVACPLMNSTSSFTNVTVGECSIGLSLHLPGLLSLKHRSIAVGDIWSLRNPSDSWYFERIAFRSLDMQHVNVSGGRYNYTRVGKMSHLCEKKDVKKTRSGIYPGRRSFDGMGFDVSVENAEKKSAWGYSVPLTVGDSFYNDIIYKELEPPITTREKHFTSKSDSAAQGLSSSKNVLNVSYTIRLNSWADFKWGLLSAMDMSLDESSNVEIAAEGVYDTVTGDLCLVGCRYFHSTFQNSSMDCEMLIQLHLPPTNISKSRYLMGFIKSTRETSDSLYFEPLKVTSVDAFSSVVSATTDIKRIDLEIGMVLISLTLACIFIGLQLFHVKKNPHVLPSLSLLMLVVLTMGHMIPLVLNFEAVFKNTTRQNVLLWSGGWLEVNEVIVRIVTMVAFLMQVRLLQLTWSARLGGESDIKVWVAEKRVVCLCLPLYLIGGLVAGFVYFKKNEIENEIIYPVSLSLAGPLHSIWEDLRSYCGLLLDGFLLPQILLNTFSDSSEKALAPSFYIGTTIVRSLPHIYDAFRARQHIPPFKSSLIYADHGGDLYSTAWDVVIPCTGFLFALILYLQQRCGGTCILPKRFRQHLKYEKVSAVSG